MDNIERFRRTLTANYMELFKQPDYSLAALRHTPAGLAEKMTNGIMQGTASIDGDGIRRTCKTLGIKPTYKAINQFLGG